MIRRLSWLPNVLTGLRLLSGIAFPWLPPEYWLPVLIYGGLSDLIDGWLSRWLQGTTACGQLLDPVADKALILAVAVTLTFYQLIDWYGLVWLAARDILVIGLMFVAPIIRRIRLSDLRPRWPGKLATVAQLIALLWLIVRMEPAPTLVFIAGLISATAGVDYTLAALQHWNPPPEHPGAG